MWQQTQTHQHTNQTKHHLISTLIETWIDCVQKSRMSQKQDVQIRFTDAPNCSPHGYFRTSGYDIKFIFDLSGSRCICVADR